MHGEPPRLGPQRACDREHAGAGRRPHAGRGGPDDERGVGHVGVAQRPAAPEHRQAEREERRERRGRVAARAGGRAPQPRAAHAKAPASDAHSNTNVGAPSFVPSAATPCWNGFGTV